MNEIARLEQAITAQNFWDDQANSQKVMQSMSALKERVTSFTSLSSALEDLEVLLELGEEEDDEATAAEVQQELSV